MRKRIKIVVTHIEGFTFRYEGFDGEIKIFQNTFPDTNGGIAEFTGAIHGLMWIKKNSNQEGDVLITNGFIKEAIDKKKYPYEAKGAKASEFLRKCKRWLSDQRSGVNVELINGSTSSPTEETVPSNFDKRKTWFSRD